MEDIKNIFIKKKILIYGLGKSGLSSYYFLKKNNNLYLYDDDKKIFKEKKIKKIFIRPENIFKNNFDFIVISPGININTCSLKNFLKKNLKKIITDLDIFYSHYFKNRNITITGTNGKSTTAKILFDILKNQKFDARLTGNIGNPILSEKKITSKTIFVIEASSYQIEYSKKFKANYALILNISPDHLERHGTFINYVKSKFKLFSNQTKQDYSFFDIKNKYLKKEIKKSKIYSQIIKVDTKSINKHIRRIKNPYFLTEGHQNNLAFIFAITKKFRLKKTNLFKVINNFKGLKYRQQIIYHSKELTLINDSKATSYSSSINILKSLKKVFWLVGGMSKLGDKFTLRKKECKNINAYIFGKKKNFFVKQFRNKLLYCCFKDLKSAVKQILFDINNNNLHKTILFSPSAASFDNFKNFEERGDYFSFLLKNYKFKKILNVIK